MFLQLLKEKAPAFVASMEDKKVPGKYRFSWSGDRVAQSKHWGLGQSTFAARILYILDALSDQSSAQVRKYIQSFEDGEGVIYDREIARRSFVKRVVKGIYKREPDYLFNRTTKRAETRQGIAALINLSSKPAHFYSDLKMDLDSIERYVKSLDWRVPWAAGSHFNHQLFFLRFSPASNEMQKERLLEIMLATLRKYVREDGFYEDGEAVSAPMKVGGLMKVLMGLALFDRAHEFVKESFVDLCLDEMIAYDACENFNTIYVLYQCSKVMEYRREETEQFLLHTAEQWKDFYFPDFGGFSFYKGKSGVNYYDAAITQGLNEPDMHGTAMFVWGFLIIAKALGVDAELDLKEPVL